MITEPTPPAGLSEIQTFLTAVLRGSDPIADDPVLAERCAVFVAGNARVSPAGQVDIYRRQYWLRHEEALREDYPGLIHVIGEDAWDALYTAYLVAHPPTAPTLRDLGHAMGDFVAGYPALPAEIAPLARSMARYERAFVDVFDGADPPPLSPTRLAALSPAEWERATIVLSPLVVRMVVTHPVHHLRKALRGGESPPLPAPAETRIALFRRDNIVCFEELDADQAALLEALASGASLVAACAQVAAGKSDEATAHLAGAVGGWFRNWAAHGFVSDVVV